MFETYLPEATGLNIVIGEVTRNTVIFQTNVNN